MSGDVSRETSMEEHIARSRKAERITTVLHRVTLAASWGEEDIRLLRLMPQEMREQAAEAAGVRSPSEATWQLAITLLEERRRAEFCADLRLAMGIWNLLGLLAGVIARG